VNTLDAVLSALTVLLGIVGAFFFFVGTVGILRLPDFYSRTHAATKCDTVGAGSIFLGLMLMQGFGTVTLKLIAITMLLLLSSPTAGHAIARAAYRTGLKPWQRPERTRGGDAA
jgi:multicomponent Na+:H+ antiporter subunit G